ncbi:MAG: hypothetical protein IPP31_01360 [Chitinophagaceae bacterium]|nr:hypothetical protein [Chitinophagaceae bacterium]
MKGVNTYGPKAILSGLICISLIFTACNSAYTSKKRGYFKIEFPDRKYDTFQQEGYPYSFEYPAYAQVVKDSTFFDSNPENPYWINIDFPQFGGRIFLSYKVIGGETSFKIKQPDGSYRDSSGINIFDKLVNDAFTLTNKNESIATSIRDSFMMTPNGVSGIFFRVGGNAATARQFYLTDTTRHFFRGALYFDVTPNADSLRPVLDFLQQDIDHLINTFRWTDQPQMKMQPSN